MLPDDHDAHRAHPPGRIHRLPKEVRLPLIDVEFRLLYRWIMLISDETDADRSVRSEV